MNKVRGIVLNSNPQTTVILTSEGEYLEIPTAGQAWQAGVEIEVDLTKLPTPVIRSGIRKRVYLGVWVASILLVLALTFLGQPLTAHTEAYLALDINPSILLSLNKKAAVLKAEAINTEGQELLQNLQLKHLDVETAVKLILEKAHTENFLSTEDNAICISLAAPANFVINEKKLHDCVSTQIRDLEIDTYLKISRAEVQQAREAQKKNVSLNSLTIRQELASQGILQEEKEPQPEPSPHSVEEITKKVGRDKVFKKEELITGSKEKKKNPPENKKAGKNHEHQKKNNKKKSKPHPGKGAGRLKKRGD